MEGKIDEYLSFPERILARKKETRVWANNRRGFKQELIESLVDSNFEYSEANSIVEAIFGSIGEALLRKEEVNVDGFGSWAIQSPKLKRAFRLGKVVKFHDRIVFTVDQQVFQRPATAHRSFHPGWENSPTRKPQLRGNKLKEHLRRQGEQRRRMLLREYTQAICHFFQDGLVGGDWQTVWTQRWTGPYYRGEFQRASNVGQPRSIEHAKVVMNETRQPVQHYPKLSPRARLNNQSIDSVLWYARWSASLDVDRDLWKEAEQLASGLLLGRN